MNILTAREARGNFYRLIDEATQSHEPIHIICKRAGVVLLAEEDWQAIQETLFLLTIPGMGESIRATMAEPLQDSAGELEW